jgi:undecaprenyl-diphosphatase
MRVGRTITAVASATAVGLAVLTAAVWLRWPPLIDFDEKINKRWYDHGSTRASWVELWRFLTHGGDTWFVLVAWAATVVALLALRRPRLALAVSVAVVLSQVVFRALRAVVDRPRPVTGFVLPDGPGYPSSHTMGAATGAVLLVLLVWSVRRQWVRAGVLAVALAWAGAVGVSRVMLGAHWPTDVLGGWLLALAAVAPIYALMARAPVPADPVTPAPPRG